MNCSTNIDNSGVYTEIFDNIIFIAKRKKELFLEFPESFSDTLLYRLADKDFYNFNNIMSALDKTSDSLIIEIIRRLLNNYRIDSQWIERTDDTPLMVILSEADQRICYAFDDIFIEDVNSFIKKYNLTSIVEIFKCNSSTYAKRIINDMNIQSRNENVYIEAINLEEFFIRHFSKEEFDKFCFYLNKTIEEVRNIIGYKSIKFLSANNLAEYRQIESNTLANFDYLNYSYQIVDPDNTNISKFKYLSNYHFSNSTFNHMIKQYITDESYKTIIGSNDYAESFITSEWLFHSLKDKPNFDYTSVISGYLKSVEQLLSFIVNQNIDNNCWIKRSDAQEIRNKAFINKIPSKFFDKERKTWNYYFYTDGNIKYYEPFDKKYFSTSNINIQFTSSQKEYADSSIGTFEHFLRNNSNIFICKDISKVIADMVSCFRVECRNGYFHTHNLKNWENVEKTRANAIFLYFVLLGGCVINANHTASLGIIQNDSFDKLSIKIREYRHYSPYFKFVYPDCSERLFFYDPFINPQEYSKEGFEHYNQITFYEVNDTSNEELDKLKNRELLKERTFLLTRESLPQKIICKNKSRDYEIIYQKD